MWARYWQAKAKELKPPGDKATEAQLKAFQDANDSLLVYFNRFNEAKVKVTFSLFSHNEGRHVLGGSVENLTDADKSYVLKFEFLDAAGTTLTLSYPALAEDAYTLTLLNRVPSRVVYQPMPWSRTNNIVKIALFAQDQWRIDRVTLSYGVRFDYNRAYAPAFTRPKGPLSAEQSFPATTCTPCWSDLSPRFGIAWDVFGDGTTAAKFGLNRYVQAGTTGLAGQFAPDSTTISNTSRQWTDVNRDFYPDCDLRNPAGNGECGAMAQPTFGQNIVTRFADPDRIQGWGKRPYTYRLSLGVDRQIAPGLAIGGGFYRSWFGNFTIADDLNLTPADYDPFCVIAPTDSRLGSVSGQEICGLYNLNPSKFGRQANTLVTNTKAINPLTGNSYIVAQETSDFGKFIPRSGTSLCVYTAMGTFPSASVGGFAFDNNGVLYAADEISRDSVLLYPIVQGEQLVECLPEAPDVAVDEEFLTLAACSGTDATSSPSTSSSSTAPRVKVPPPTQKISAGDHSRAV